MCADLHCYPQNLLSDVDVPACSAPIGLSCMAFPTPVCVIPSHLPCQVTTDLPRPMRVLLRDASVGDGIDDGPIICAIIALCRPMSLLSLSAPHREINILRVVPRLRNSVTINVCGLLNLAPGCATSIVAHAEWCTE